MLNGSSAAGSGVFRWRPSGLNPAPGLTPGSSARQDLRRRLWPDHRYRCAYVDQTGTRCGCWCEEHSVYMNGRNWCQRHANSVKGFAPATARSTILATAAVDDRSPNLAGILVDELNGEITSHLVACFSTTRACIVTDGLATSAPPRCRRVGSSHS
jgi:hypothetical protein